VSELLALFWESLAGAVMIALASSVLGVYVVLRRVVFVGAALAQLSSAGVALAAFLASSGVGLGLLTGRFFLAMLLTVSGVALLAVRSSRGRVPADSGLGMAFVVAGAASVLLVARSATADIHDLFFGGDVLLMSRSDVVRIAVVGGAVLLLHAVAAKEFVFVSCDPEMASALGYRVDRWNLLLYLGLAAVMTVSMSAVGVLLAFGYLVLPAVCGLLLARRLPGVFGWSVASGVVGTFLGFLASLRLDLPSGATVICVLALLTLGAWLTRSLRGRGRLTQIGERA
jgi:ABC-type Mn2+/Zn2+ transport system permease subunit